MSVANWNAVERGTLDVAVAFFVFNRPSPTRRVFERIRTARPNRLFVIADGPRVAHATDGKYCAEVRSITEEVDWPCTVERNYSPTNLGSGRRVSSGLDWVFTRVEQTIVLEDDCVPDGSFFPYCAELLERFAHEPRVGLISGSHHQYKSSHGDYSYYFCRYGNTWGWATWRRAWEKFDFSMSEWAQWRDDGNLERLFPDKDVQRFWRDIWDNTPGPRHDAWDYQWTFCYLKHGMLGILPHVSLIDNIGFGSDATHTYGMDYRVDIEPMRFPLRHPKVIEPDLEAEARASARFFSRKPMHRRALARMRRVMSKMARVITRKVGP